MKIKQISVVGKVQDNRKLNLRQKGFGVECTFENGAKEFLRLEDLPQLIKVFPIDYTLSFSKKVFLKEKILPTAEQYVENCLRLRRQVTPEQVLALLKRQEEKIIGRWQVESAATKKNLSVAFVEAFNQGKLSEWKISLLDIYHQLNFYRLRDEYLPPDTMAYRGINFFELNELARSGNLLFRGERSKQISFLLPELPICNVYESGDAGVVLEISTGGKFKFCDEHFYEESVFTDQNHRPYINRVLIKGAKDWSSLEDFLSYYKRR